MKSGTQTGFAKPSHKTRWREKAGGEHPGKQKISVKLLLLALLLTSPGLARPHQWEEQGVQITLLGSERTPDRRYVLIHLSLRALVDVGAFSWSGLCQVVNRQGEQLPQPGDCGVDQKITSGNFRVLKGRPVRVLLYYLARPEDFPVHIEVRGEPIGTVLR